MKIVEERCRVCDRPLFNGECVFDHNTWVEVKDAPIPDIDTLMFYIEAYRSPQGHTSPQEFKKEVRALIERYVSKIELDAKKTTLQYLENNKIPVDGDFLKISRSKLAKLKEERR